MSSATEYLSLVDTIGLTVFATYSDYTGKSRKPKDLSPHYILFSDNQTYIELVEQDYYVFHDCDSTAVLPCVRRDAGLWAYITNTYVRADCSEPCY